MVRKRNYTRREALSSIAAAAVATGVITSTAEAVSLEPAQLLTATKVASGSTKPGATKWQQTNPNEIYVLIDTSAANFVNTPVYVASLGGSGGHYVTLGASSIYAATPTSFTLYIKFANGNPLNPTIANNPPFQFFVNWIGVGK